MLVYKEKPAVKAIEPPQDVMAKVMADNVGLRLQFEELDVK